MDNVIDVRDFGVLISNKDNSSGLLDIRDFIRKDRTREWNIYFPECGVYQYADNKWLIGVGRVVIHANGATLQCTKAGGAVTATRRPLYIPHFFYEAGDSEPLAAALSVLNSGCLIDSANVGDKTINLQDCSDSGNYQVGAWVVVAGYEQQGLGFPANLRYFDYAKVEFVNDLTGEITLDRKLSNNYDSRWKDRFIAGSNDQGFGSPRVLSLNRELYNIPEYIKIIGGKWIGPPGEEYLGINLGAVIDSELQNICLGDYFVVSGDNHRIINSKIDKIEPDKIINRVEIRDTYLGDVVGGTGVNLLSFEKCSLNGDFKLSPRNLVCRDNKFNNTTINGGSTASVFSAGVTAINNVLFDGNEWNIYTPPTFGVNWGSVCQITIDGVTSNNEIKLSPENESDFISGVDYGTFLIKEDGSNSGVVTDIYWDEVGNLTVAGTWSKQVNPLEVWNYHRVKNVILNDFNKKNNIKPTYLFGNLKDSKTGTQYKTILKNSDIDFRNLGDSGYVELRGLGFITSVKVMVLRPYSGLGLNPRIRVQNRNLVGSGAGSNIATVNTATIGARVVESGFVLCGGAGDTLTPASIGEYITAIRIWAEDMPGGVDDLPVVEIEVNYIRELT